MTAAPAAPYKLPMFTISFTPRLPCEDTTIPIMENHGEVPPVAATFLVIFDQKVGCVSGSHH